MGPAELGALMQCPRDVSVSLPGLQLHSLSVPPGCWPSWLRAWALVAPSLAGPSLPSEQISAQCHSSGQPFPHALSSLTAPYSFPSCDDHSVYSLHVCVGDDSVHVSPSSPGCERLRARDGSRLAHSPLCAQSLEQCLGAALPHECLANTC